MEHKKIILPIISIAILGLASCSTPIEVSSSISSLEPSSTSSISETPKRDQDIVVLYTTDVHCAIDDNIGYAGLASYRNEMNKYTDYVSLIDCGDAIQGKTIGTVSQGQYIVDIMNELNYDICTIGNHEFDYGMPQLGKLISKSDASYIGCNIKYTGTGESELKEVKPYKILDYGDTSVAYIGVLTPFSTTSSTPKYFMDDNGNFIYDFYSGNNGADFYQVVQNTVDQVKTLGADYVVLCSHLGRENVFSPYSSEELIANTTGVDVVLDGHAHENYPSYYFKNKDNKNVIISSSGTELNSIGKLVISPEGDITTTTITNYQDKDETTKAYIDNIKSSFETELNKVLGTSNITLSGYDANKIRMVRNRETTIGDFCADAYRESTSSDIAFVNGGGVRADLNAGNITYNDLIAIHPFGNYLCTVSATGQEILDSLEVAYRKVLHDYTDGTLAVGESGGFFQISGMTLEIDPTITSGVIFDANNMFDHIEGERRVKNVKVLDKNGVYQPLVVDKEYKVTANAYVIKNGGDGNNVFMDNPLLLDESCLDYESLINYVVDTLKGDLATSYSTTHDRITVL